MHDDLHVLNMEFVKGLQNTTEIIDLNEKAIRTIELATTHHFVTYHNQI